MAHTRKNQIRQSQGCRLRARAIHGSPITRLLRGARPAAACARENQIRPRQGGGRRERGIPGSAITRMSRGARCARKKINIRPSQGERRARAGNTQFSQNRHVTRRACAKTRSAGLKAAGGAHKQYPLRPYQECHAARARKNQICPSQGSKRRARAIPGSPITRMSRARKNQIHLSQGGRRRTQAIPGSPITRMSRGAGAQKPHPPVSRRQAARAGNTRLAHNKDVARRARAKTRSACPKAAGGARRQYPVEP